MPFSREELTQAFPLFGTLRVVRFQDVDAAGIVFFPRFYEYFHDTYVELLSACGFDLPARLDEGVWGMPLVHAEADFLRPLRFGDAICVEVVALRESERSVAFGFRVRREGGAKSGEVCAVGETVHAFLERASMRSCPMPPSFRDVLSRAKAGTTTSSPREGAGA